MKQKALTTMINLSSDVNEICSTLQLKKPIKHFTYAKIYRDGSRIHLMNDPKWFERYYQQGYYQIGLYEDPPWAHANGYSLLIHKTSQKRLAINEDAEHFHIYHPFYLINKHEDCCELFIFACHKNTATNFEYYFSHINELKAFATNFKEKITSFSQLKKTQRIIIETNNIEHIEKVEYTKNITKENIRNFINDIR